MVESVGVNSEGTQSGEEKDKKKSTRELFLNKFHGDKNQSDTNPSRSDTSNDELDPISAVREAYGVKKYGSSGDNKDTHNSKLFALEDESPSKGPQLFMPNGVLEKPDNGDTVPVSSNKLSDLSKQLAERRSSEEKMEEELNILVPSSSKTEPQSDTSQPETIESPDDGEKPATVDEEAFSGSTVEATKSTVEVAKVDVNADESLDNLETKEIDIAEPEKEKDKSTLLEGDNQDVQKTEVDDTVESTEDQLKNLIEETKPVIITTTKEESIEETEEGAEEKQKIDIITKIKNLFKQEEVEIEPYDPALHGPLAVFKGLKGYEEVERYWVNEPYAFVVILFNSEINNHIYYVVEPELSEFEETFLTEIKDRLTNVLLVEEIEDKDDKGAVLDSKIRAIIKDYAIEVTPVMLEKISYYIKRDFVRFGKIDPLMHDDTIEDVSGNGHDTPIFLYHKKHQNIATNIVFAERAMDSFIIRLAQKSGKHISVAEPMVDATMPDGSRIQMTLGTTVTTHGSTFTIRKFSDVPITPIDLINWGTFSAESMAYLWLCIENNKSLIYAGGTASGKTSSLNAVSLFIPQKAKVITLEDTRELKLPHINWIPGVTRDSFTADERGSVDMYDLLKAALRQRPEYLLVGEVRGKEALTLFQAMSTGHTTFSTMHADSVASAIHRLENPPISVPRTMIQALDIMSIQAQTYSHGKRVRRNLKLIEIIDIDPNTRNIRTNDIFEWDSATDSFHRTGESKALADIQMRRGWTYSQVKQELMYRQKVLEYLVDNNVSDFGEISGIINAYQLTPEKVLKKLKLTE